MSLESQPFLKVEGLCVDYALRSGGPFRAARTLRAVHDISFQVARGASFGIVGESGSGKSTTAAAVMRLIALSAGRIALDGTALDALAGEELRVFRRRLQIVFQDPFSSLNPRARVGEIIREPLDIQGIGTTREREARVGELLSLVGLRPEVARAFPHQFSGGQRQRIGIARALATNPELVVCDEPVSALDVAIQAQILNLLKRLQREKGLTYLFISHDLGVVKYMCDHVAVMYLGQIVESGPTGQVFAQAAHPYTQALLAARPSIHGRRGERPAVRVTGDPPAAMDPSKGCRFAGRCPFVREICRTEAPKLRLLTSGQDVACHLVPP